MMEQFRTGRPNGRTIYVQRGAQPSEHDEPIGMLDTPELATFAVAAMNAATMLVAALPGVRRPAAAPSPLPIEAAESTKRQCPGCLREVSVRANGKHLQAHNDKPHGGKRCDGQPKKERRTYRQRPDNFVELLANHGGSAAALAKELDVPAYTVQNWKDRELAQQARRAQLAALPLIDPEDPPRSGAA